MFFSFLWHCFEGKKRGHQLVSWKVACLIDRENEDSRLSANEFITNDDNENWPYGGLMTCWPIPRWAWVFPSWRCACCVSAAALWLPPRCWWSLPRCSHSCTCTHSACPGIFSQAVIKGHGKYSQQYYTTTWSGSIKSVNLNDQNSSTVLPLILQEFEGFSTVQPHKTH